MAEVICFGEILLRLSPPQSARFGQAKSFDFCFGGAEVNTAVGLCGLGTSAGIVSLLPDNPLGRTALGELRRHGVDCSGLGLRDGRMGLYFLEKGASQRPSSVLYDRAGSVFSLAKDIDFDFKTLLSGAKHLHLTGITPALGAALPGLCLNAVRVAKELGVSVSFDPNYRAKLWGVEEAASVIKGLMPYVDLCISNLGQAADIFGIHTHDAELAARSISEAYGCKTVAITQRTALSASINRWSAGLWSAGSYYSSREYEMQIVDRVGGGDAFAAGLIYAHLKAKPPQEQIELAAAAGCLKHSIQGDFPLFSLQELEALAGGDTAALVRR
ncbi:MAG: sugar kinase [Clostridium sp.]|nr:sugar kinase [Clostridium sp.]